MDAHRPATGYALLLGAVLTVSATISGADTPAGGEGPLDGMVFQGDFGPKGGPADRTDALHFQDGRFWSENCVPCGFRPGVYWVRREAGRLHFKGELRSADRGRFRISGHLDGNTLHATIRWRRERWYWTVSRTFSFTGRLDPDSRPAELQAAVRRASGQPLPDADCQL